MKREVLKRYLVITFFFFLLIFAYYIYKESDNILKDDYVTFSKDSGFYNETISVKLSRNIDLPFGTDIYYTLNGNDPTNESTKYEGPIKLELIEDTTKVYPLKVVAYHNNKYSNIMQKTYVIDKNLEKNDIRIVSVTSDEKNLYDYDTGILVRGKTYDENVKNGKTGYIPGNYNQRDEEWEKEAIITIFDQSGVVDYDTKSGIIVSGGQGSSWKVKSFNIIANKYNSNNKINLDFPSEYSISNTSFVNSYNRIRIRSGSSDYNKGNIRSSIGSRLAEQSNFDGCTTTERAIVFLNGDFYGIFDLQQSYSDSFIANKYNLTDSELIEKKKGNESTLLKGVINNYIKSGDNKDLEKSIDMDNYLLYYAIEILMNNLDWPEANFEMWKYNGKYENSNRYTDGKYRFLLYDLDYTYFSENIFDREIVPDIFVEIMENIGKGSNSSFKIIVDNKYYRDKYVMLTQDLLNTSFKKDNILKIVDEESKKINKSYKKFFSSVDYNNFVNFIKILKTNIKDRDDTLKEDFKNYFKLDKTHLVTVKANEGIQVNFTNQELYQNEKYSNNYYTDIDLIYNYKEYPDYKFSYWLVNNKKVYDKELVIESAKYKDIDKINIEAVAKYQKEDNHLIISEIYANGDSDWIKITNSGKESINLTGYYLSDRENKLLKYELPNIVLSSKESIIINGDKNYYSVGDYICNFSIKKSEKIVLSKDNNIIDSIVVPKMSDIETYGRYDNSNTYKFFKNIKNERKKG